MLEADPERQAARRAVTDVDDEQFVAGLPSVRVGRAAVVVLHALSPPEQTARCREARPRTGRVTRAPATDGPAARR